MKEYDFNIFCNFNKRNEERDDHASIISRASFQQHDDNTTKQKIENATRSKLNTKLRT